ncbi:MAG: DUF2202 domain-containing protein [Acidimicrobiales bacterium]
MKKMVRRPIPILAVALATSLAAAACGSDNAAPSTPTAVTSSVVPSGAESTTEPGSTDAGSTDAGSTTDAVTPIPADEVQAAIETIPVSGLTPAEREGLLHMREEEKLALDVYQALYERWPLPVFDNIAAAEATHTASVKVLLDRYGLADPAAGRAAGSFESQEMQALYDALVAQGSGSLVDALTVGATIEDLDIADLRARATDTPDIALVYANLERGSRNHLRAFSAQLEGQGAGYTPLHITQSDYDAIVAGAIERGPAA